MAQRALITGVTGQDGAYLAKLLLEKNYEVYGGHRRVSSPNVWRLEELGIAADVRMITMDLLEFTNILRTIEKVQPDEVYNLAAQSFVGISFEQPIYTSDVDGLGVARLIEAIRAANPKIRFYQASTSEMFGKVRETPQTEQTPFHPRSPYAIAKLYAHCLTGNYREAYRLHATCGILFNHESPLRGIDFVTRKITASLARIRHGQQDVLELGNLESKRDWGFAGDYVEAMWSMLQQPEGEDYVVATGVTHSVREFVERAAEQAGFALDWKGEKENTQGIDRKTGKTVVRINPEFYRPTEVDLLIGDASKARQRLNWAPKVTLEELTTMMVEADLKRASEGRLIG
jgi:GDPmannose 4,6-dehydratase